MKEGEYYESDFDAEACEDALNRIFSGQLVSKPDEIDTLRAELANLRVELEACREENAELRIALEDHNSGSKQLAKWLEESRVEAMDAKRKAASDRARVRMMRDDLGQLLERHRKDGITALFLALEVLMQKVMGLDR